MIKLNVFITMEKAIGIDMSNAISPSWSFDLNNSLLPHFGYQFD